MSSANVTPPRIHPVRSTYALLAARCRHEDSSEAWIDWALELLEAGYDSEHIVELAGSGSASNSFVLQELRKRALAEAGVGEADCGQVLLEYAWYLADEALEGNLPVATVLQALSRLCSDLHYPDHLLPLYRLCEIATEPVLYGYTAEALNAESEHELCDWLHRYEGGQIG